MLILGAWYVSLLAVLFGVVCLFLMLVILIQRPRGGGLAGAFGGAGGAAQTAFGARVGDLLTWVTVVCFVLFILLAMALTWATRPARIVDAGQATQLPANTPPATTQPATAPATTPEAPAAPTTQPGGAE